SRPRRRPWSSRGRAWRARPTAGCCGRWLGCTRSLRPPWPSAGASAWNRPHAVFLAGSLDLPPRPGVEGSGRAVLACPTPAASAPNQSGTRPGRRPAAFIQSGRLRRRVDILVGDELDDTLVYVVRGET